VLALEALHRGTIAAHAKHGDGHQDGDETMSLKAMQNRSLQRA
jgi:hypothetical protein